MARHEYILTKKKKSHRPVSAINIFRKIGFVMNSNMFENIGLAFCFTIIQKQPKHAPKFGHLNHVSNLS